MRVLLDEGIPARTAVLLRQKGGDASHLVELGMLGANDGDVMARAVSEQAAIVTMDSDFHQLRALGGCLAPSVIRIRMEGLSTKRWHR